MTKLIKPDPDSVSQFEPFYHVPKEEFERIQADQERLRGLLIMAETALEAHHLRGVIDKNGTIIMEEIQQALKEIKDETHPRAY